MIGVPLPRLSSVPRLGRLTSGRLVGRVEVKGTAGREVVRGRLPLAQVEPLGAGLPCLRVGPQGVSRGKFGGSGTWPRVGLKVERRPRSGRCRGVRGLGAVSPGTGVVPPHESPPIERRRGPLPPVTPPSPW